MTTRATEAALRLIDYLDASPVAGVTIVGWYDDDPDRDVSPGFSGEGVLDGGITPIVDAIRAAAPEMGKP